MTSKHRGPALGQLKRTNRKFASEAHSTRIATRKGGFKIDSDQLKDKVEEFLSDGGEIKKLTDSGELSLKLEVEIDRETQDRGEDFVRSGGSVERD